MIWQDASAKEAVETCRETLQGSRCWVALDYLFLSALPLELHAYPPHKLFTRPAIVVAVQAGGVAGAVFQ